MDRFIGACPVCGCELATEAFMYRCWCCGRSYSYSEVKSLAQDLPEQRKEQSRDENLVEQSAFGA